MPQNRDKKPDDPTEDEQFKHVVEHFLRTPPKPHKPESGKKRRETHSPSPATPSGQKSQHKDNRRKDD